ncbi:MULTISPECIES: protein kinase domain-containing protein [Streptomyces]|uniref:protein kinase domain-containing protein n=1 Tax=Streptomyces TaxID=1883 RepID=UPI0022499C9B|nr:protein kinase [Streptomyces sp. JHD 1]MCX2968065.1 protein kinase [Streptomyces sp. JHD 1]
MGQTQTPGGPQGPDEPGNGASTPPSGSEGWGNGGLVGDGRYRLTRRLGRGGMAEVFAAEDVRLGRTVAVKLLRADLAEDPTAKARFTREAQSVAGLNHHAVVAVYDSGEDTADGATVPYIVMELVEGRTIRELLLTADAPPPDQALIIVSGVLEALAYSHQHGIVHRDIKPANVIITDTGAVKVMDFGIARALHGVSTTMTQTGMVMGTPQYLSPEQALGKTVDARSDLYATGCLLYELLTRRPPFTGETPLSVVYQHVQDEPVRPSEVTDGVPPELDGLVMRSLAKDPDDRFQSAEEMRGLIGYALRQLQEQGSHTGGLWNTGSVHTTGATPAMGLGAVAGAAGGGYDATARLGDTAAQPGMLLGRPDRDDWGHPRAASGGYDGDPREGGRGGSGLKYALVSFFAVLAVAAGILFALNNTGEDGGGTGPVTETTSATPSDEESEASQEPEDTPSNEAPTEEGTGGGYPEPRDPGTPDPPITPREPSDDPSGPSGEPTTGGTDGGGTDTGGGDTGGTDTGGGGETGGGDTGGGGDDAGGGGEATGGEASGGDQGGAPGGGGGDPAGTSGGNTGGGEPGGTAEGVGTTP